MKNALAALPFRIDLKPVGGHLSGPNMVLVHGTPTLNTVYWTEDRPDAFCLKMSELAGAKTGDAICFGHTHKPWYRVIEGIHFVNTGSVGRFGSSAGRAVAHSGVRDHQAAFAYIMALTSEALVG